MMMKTNLQECARGCGKGILLATNMLSILMALSTMALAVVDARFLKQYWEEQADGTFLGNVAVFMASVLLIVVSVFGCAGALRDKAKLLYLYTVLLMILVIVQLLVGIFMSVKRYGLEFRVTDWLREDFFRNATGDAFAEHARLWDNLQTTYECCGLNGPEDYPATQQPISLSCCPRAYRARAVFTQQQLYNHCLETASYFSGGCEEDILFNLRAGSDCFLSMAVVCFWMEAVGMLIAMWMANNLKHEATMYKCSTVRY